MRGETGGRSKRWDIWLIHVDVWWKPTKFCKAIILQLKNKLQKKTFCIAKVTVNKMKDNPQTGRKYFQQSNQQGINLQTTELTSLFFKKMERA